jgi:hypothetical protein
MAKNKTEILGRCPTIAHSSELAWVLRSRNFSRKWELAEIKGPLGWLCKHFPYEGVHISSLMSPDIEGEPRLFDKIIPVRSY